MARRGLRVGRRRRPMWRILVLMLVGLALLGSMGLRTAAAGPRPGPGRPPLQGTATPTGTDTATPVATLRGSDTPTPVGTPASTTTPTATGTPTSTPTAVPTCE